MLKSDNPNPDTFVRKTDGDPEKNTKDLIPGSSSVSINNVFKDEEVDSDEEEKFI